MERTNDSDGLRELIRELEELHDAQEDLHVPDLLWTLLANAEEYRRVRNEGSVLPD